MTKIKKLEESLRLKDFIPIYGIIKYADRCYFAKKERDADFITSLLSKDKGFDYTEAIKCVNKSMNNALILSLSNGLLLSTPFAYFLFR
ncbi:MAG: hypothetical protein KKF46_00260 [Nanoarchaeota archaeon]|nr:hypothetical protein [Nanoarchaeota archaeon]MBU1320766.1 hypothetical protein [Nanoarchaeota archaeon]MBU1598133.1 hypothetical protein [Nanoarchaeota archaeon]MBU2441971.1 hypothetical protein [Nanoarchaeota archaeon]